VLHPPDARIEQLERENQALRAELADVKAKAEKANQARATLMRGGFRLLIPIFDREKVARSFGKLVETLGDFDGPREKWPNREQILADARVFLESCVRFAVRRRMFLFFVGLLGAVIPAVQVWLVVQQNQIIENQNKFSENQDNDVVARSMTQGDRNARLMTVALLANADPDFLTGVVRESFDPSLASVYRAEGVNAAARRLDDAAYRGNLVRAAVRSVAALAAKKDIEETYSVAQPMLQWILVDAGNRVPEVLRLGRDVETLDGELAEQVDHYLVQIGSALEIYARLGRSAGQLSDYARDITPFLTRLSQRSIGASPGRFDSVMSAVLQDVLFDAALAPKLGDPPVNLGQAGITPEVGLQQGLSRLQSIVQSKAVQWPALTQQAGAR
jgi:hypothetical protein